MAYTDIDKPSDYFNTKTYTGTGTSGGNTLGVTGVGFQPDWVWVKNRTVAVNHYLYDVVRGTGSAKALGSNTTASESSFSTYSVNGGVASLDSDGFTAYRGTDNTYQGTNKSGNNYVAWNWLADGSASSNTDGSITSNVSANTTAGFSIVTYTLPSSGTVTVGHGLGTKPALLITKSRDNSYNWDVLHQDLNDDGVGRIILNSANAYSTGNNPYASTTPTSSVFSFSADFYGASDNVTYCFAEKKGYSKFGSYTGNGSSDGTFVYTGMKPAVVIFKNTSSSSQWIIYDTARNVFNPVNSWLNPNRSNAEGTNSSFPVDFLSNGFKIRNTDIAWNASGDNYIYMAFAENPFVTSTGIPATAR